MPHMLRFQQERDEAGGGVSLRFAAEAALERSLGTPGLRRQEAKALVLRCFDRLLSDDARCAAYEDAIDAAVRGGVRTACVLGSGSLLPALLLAQAGVAVCVVEPVSPLADIARACARDNELRLAVLPTITAAAHVWRGPPDLLVSEAINDGLFGELVLPKLREARRALATAATDAPSGVTRRSTTLLPCRAALSGVLVQLGFEGVSGFGLDGLGVDLRHFDALRPSGQRAAVAPGYWPVRLSGWRQPHALLSSSFALGEVDFDTATAPGAIPGAGGVGGPPSAREVVATRDGLLNAVVYYFNLHVGPGAPPVSSAPPERDDRPGSWRAGWRQAAVYLERPVYVRAGERLSLGWRVSEDGIRFDVACMPLNPQSDAESSQQGAFATERAFLPEPPLAEQTRQQPVAPPPPPPAGLSPSAMVPCNAYHFCMMADTARNEAYRRAITRAVSRFKAGRGNGGKAGGSGGCRVLDIGAGSGLLGVMAARAGATHIDAVEMNRVLAETAARTLEASGVQSFRVYGCLSTQLTVNGEQPVNTEHAVNEERAVNSECAMSAEQGMNGRKDAVRRDAARGKSGDRAGAQAGGVADGRRLASRADIIVSETLDTSLIGEGAIHSLRHAAAELLRQARSSPRPPATNDAPIPSRTCCLGIWGHPPPSHTLPLPTLAHFAPDSQPPPSQPHTFTGRRWAHDPILRDRLPDGGRVPPSRLRWLRLPGAQRFAGRIRPTPTAHRQPRLPFNARQRPHNTLWRSRVCHKLRRRVTGCTYRHPSGCVQRHRVVVRSTPRRDRDVGGRSGLDRSNVEAERALPGQAV